MQIFTKDVPAYIDQAPEERKAALRELRRLCLELLEGYEETMTGGMPAYLKDGVAEAGFASQVQYISLYICKKKVVDDNRPLLAGLNVGKCCIRYPSAKRIDFGVVRKLLEETVASEEQAC